MWILNWSKLKRDFQKTNPSKWFFSLLNFTWKLIQKLVSLCSPPPPPSHFNTITIFRVSSRVVFDNQFKQKRLLRLLRSLEDTLSETVEDLTTEKVANRTVLIFALPCQCPLRFRQRHNFTLWEGWNIRTIYDTEKTADPYICSSSAHIFTTDLERYTWVLMEFSIKN